MKIRIVRFDGDRAANNVRARRRIAETERHDAQQLQCVGMIRILRQDLATRSLGLAQSPGDLLQPAQRPERVAECKAGVEAGHQRLGRAGEMVERLERLLEPGRRLAVRRSRIPSHAGLDEVRDCFRPHLSVKGVMGERLDVLTRISGR